jgi:DNA-binding NtrC family response regulator
MQVTDPHRPHVLVVDDDPDIRDVVTAFAQRTGFNVTACADGRQAIDLLRTLNADLAIVDLRMPEIGGLDVLRAIRRAVPACQTILMTGFESVGTAVEAVKLGALDYLVKPLDFDRVRQLLQDVHDEIERRRSLLSMDGDMAQRFQFEGMIGRSAVMQQLFNLIRRLAPHVRTALITGETGTGKELVARALHRLGPRRDKRFVVVNCSAVVETLFESELFGHARGAFTGATDHKAGLFEVADGGTLFLDEVGELPLSVQAKLLRALESGDVHRVGSLEPRRVNVHVIAATNRNFPAEIAAGRFRSDLFYRLSIVEVAVPPLRERREDIPYLIAAFVRECSGRLGTPLQGLSIAAERLLVSSAWAGNVRELRNIIERACILADGELITEQELERCLPAAPARPSSQAAQQIEAAIDAAPAPEVLDAVERRHIQDALRKTGGNKKAAASLLGLSRRALYRRLERLEAGEL